MSTVLLSFSVVRWIMDQQKSEGITPGEDVFIILRLDGRVRKSGRVSAPERTTFLWNAKGLKIQWEDITFSSSLTLFGSVHSSISNMIYYSFMWNIFQDRLLNFSGHAGLARHCKRIATNGSIFEQDRKIAGVSWIIC